MWVSSTTHAASTTSCPSGRVPVSAASRTSSGRNRLPPAASRCDAASVTYGVRLCTCRASSLSTKSIRSCSLPREIVVADRQGQGSGHLTNSPARAARSSSGPGTTPRTRVAAEHSATVAAVSTDGWVTVGPAPIGSEKYISTMTRT